MESTQITISADINGDEQKIWDYYTKPEHIVNWNFASDDWCCPSASNDMKVGGKYIARMEAKDGSFGFDFSATYTSIIPMKEISYTLDDDRKVSTIFESKNGVVKVTTTFEAENSNPVDMQRDGWQAILNNFKKYIEQN